MANDRARMLALAKVLIAAAWADGEITPEERNSLKDLIFHLSDTGVRLSAREWELLEMYMDSPIEADERARLVADLQDAIRTPAEKQYVLDALRQMATADGELPPDENDVIQEMGRAIQQADVGLFDDLNRLLGGALRRRTEAVANAPNREAHFEDFLKNKVYFALRQDLEREGRTLDISDAELRRMGLVGGLMARVAHVDRTVTEAEREAMIDAIHRHWAASRETAAFVADVALASVNVNYDFYRMTRQFGTTTSLKERRKFIELLFHIAAADGDVSFDETEEIRLVARGINLSHQDFIEGKLAVTGNSAESHG